MYDFLIDTVTNLIRHGLNQTAIVLSIIALFRVNAVRRVILRRLPKRFRTEDNLERIERKIDALLAKEGVKWESVSTLNGLGTRTALTTKTGLHWYLVKSIVRSVGKYTNWHIRGNHRMKTYLKKLGSRKFQAFLIVTITNLIILGGYLMGNIDLEGKVEQWMPAINLIVQAVVTGVYQWVEGKADAAGASNSGESYH